MKANGDDYTPPLPGLEYPAAPVAQITAAVRATFDALEAADLLEPRHVGLMALALELADALAAAKVSRRATAVALVARELRETLAALPQPSDDDDQAWTLLEQELADAARRAAGSDPA